MDDSTESEPEREEEPTSPLSFSESVEEAEGSAESLVRYEASKELKTPEEVKPMLEEFEEVSPTELFEELPPKFDNEDEEVELENDECNVKVCGCRS